MSRQGCKYARCERAWTVCSRAIGLRRSCVFSAGLTLAVALLAGCTGVSRSTIDSIGLVWRGSSKLDPTAEQVRSNPYFQMHASTADGDAILILGNVVGPRQYWYGTHGIALVLEHGRIVQTMGLPQNLDGSRIETSVDPFAAGLQHLGETTTYQRIDDWSPGYRYGIPVRAELVSSGTGSVDVLGESHRVLLVNETVQANAARYRTSNRYWVDPADGVVWMSEQEVLPGLTIKLVSLRPYRGER